MQIMSNAKHVLVFLPTFDEVDNVQNIYRQIQTVLPEADILFIDDNSPDGTGRLLDEIASDDPRVTVIHRSGKLGVGSAHVDAINWAYDHDYQILVTMDCDLAHSPEYIQQFLDADYRFAVVTGSRFQSPDSLREWNLNRKLITHLGHFLTRTLLGMPYDATGAFRRYDLHQIPREFLEKIRSHGYSFFFESLHVLYANRLLIHEVPIHLPARTYGTSKMRLNDVFGGFWDLLKQAFNARFRKTWILIATDQDNSPDAWNGYWKDKRQSHKGRIYDRIARFYRRFLIKPCLNYFLHKHFLSGAKILHAGCGSGAVDEDIIKSFDIVACDFSDRALEIYKANNNSGAKLVKADLFVLDIEGAPFDGLYNLGVMEHFTWPEIDILLSNFRRVVKPNGLVVLFWPPEYGLSVMVLKAVHFLLNDVLGKNIALHPAEPSKVRSRKQVRDVLQNNGFQLEEFYFGPRDMFTHAIIVGRRLD
jgi:dolichol-phosphate mannosyltransferase